MSGSARSLILGVSLLAVGACGDEPAPSSDAEPESGDAKADADAKSESAAEAPPSAPPAPPEPPPTGLAVARVGGLMFTSSDGSIGFELPPLSGQEGVTINVVGRTDDRLEVETLADTKELHCAGTLSGLKDFRLRLYMEEGDLMSVVTRETSLDFEDGSRVRLAPGVVAPESATVLQAGEVAIETPIPEDARGHYFLPGRAFSKESPEGRLFSDEPLKYGGGKILDEEGLHEHDGGTAYFARTTKDAKEMVTVRSACAEILALAEAPRFEPELPKKSGLYAMKGPEAGILGTLEEGHFLASPYGGAFAVGGDDEDVWGGLTGSEVGEAYGVGGLGLVGVGGGGLRTEYEVKAGTAVVWGDGRPAGQVVADHVFDEPPRDQGGRSCFDVPLARESGPTVTLCFTPSDVRETSDSGGGTIGLGSTGLIGLGGGGGTGSGYGRGSGAGFGGRGKRVPRVRQAKAKVKGALDRDIIRRIVRAHINEVRHCYNSGLVKDPSLAGRVAIQFTIGPTGKVPVAVVQSSTVKDEDVSNCIAKAVKRWKFPKPRGGGNVVVTYPFVLSPG